MFRSVRSIAFVLRFKEVCIARGMLQLSLGLSKNASKFLLPSWRMQDLANIIHALRVLNPTDRNSTRLKAYLAPRRRSAPLFGGDQRRLGHGPLLNRALPSVKENPKISSGRWIEVFWWMSLANCLILANRSLRHRSISLSPPFIGFFQSVITVQRELRVDWQIDVFPSDLTRHLDRILDVRWNGDCYKLSFILGGS